MQFRPLFLFLCLAMYLTSVRAGAEEKEAVSIANRHADTDAGYARSLSRF